MRRGITIVAFALALGANGARAQTDDRPWHLLQKRYDNSVVAEGLTTTMTKHECEFARARILGRPATDEEKEAAAAQEAVRLEQSRKEAAEWRREHPECNTDPPPTDKPSCWNTTIFVGDITSRLVNMTNIASAECFQ